MHPPQQLARHELFQRPVPQRDVAGSLRIVLAPRGNPAIELDFSTKFRSLFQNIVRRAHGGSQLG